MSVKVDTDWRYRDIQTVILENDLLKVVVMPDLGAKVWQVTYKPRGKDFLWHNPRLKPRQLPFHSVYDDQFFGGWDELFPNDIPETIGGEALPDHGEIWTLPWQYAVEKADADEVAVKLWTHTPISSCRVEKTITLRTGESKLRFSHRIVNDSSRTLPFLWKLHAAMTVDEFSRIDLPAKRVYVEDFGSPRVGFTQHSYSWPYSEDQQGGRHDMRKALSASSGISEFQYATDMAAGWCALTHTKDKLSFALAYDAKTLPHCWLFASYGGWRDLNTVILEPCTGYPVSINNGMEQGTHAVLASGESLICSVITAVVEGFTSVEQVDADGNIFGKAYEEDITA